MTVVLPYQEGDSICDAEAFTKVLNSSENIETSINNEAVHAREVFMIRRPRSTLIPPEAPNVRSSDELESNISPFAQGHESETDSQKQARERRNKLKQGRRRRARQRKEAWARYESDLAEYIRRKSEQEMEEMHVARMTHNSPYTKIEELAEELEAISHPNVEQEHLREILRSTAIQIQGGKALSKQPARSNSQRQDNQSQ
jgi:hypothetical protein